jgi:tetratricopeptide (TPR) repeat protein
VDEYRLEVREFAALDRWRWVLTAPGGRFLADHEVRLDTRCWQFEAFTDLQSYLYWHAAPDRRVDDEVRIVAEVGEWIGAEVFGPVATALVKARPTSVRVVVPTEPAEARWLLFRPLELGHAGGRPLAVQDVTLVMELAGDNGGAVAPVGERLRVLGLFSLPEGGQPLNLRRERHALVQGLARIGAVGGRAVEVRVLQYGVTRERLEEMLEEDESWDVIHISGHGGPGELLLETREGAPDPVSAEELAQMLELARDRVKLVSVSACWSAALTAAEQRRLLGLPESGEPESRSAESGEATRVGAEDAAAGGRDGGFAAGALATELAGRLGCAVLAMRYPVVDDFAIAMSGKLYDLLVRAGRPLPRAVGMTLRDVVADPPTAACPALSAATPALFGARAVGLRLAAPARTQAQSYEVGGLKLAGFPPQPDRFVGRTGVMARASAALAADSGLAGMVLHGMPGAGKTACALELAYTHEHAFDRLVWFRAPDEGRDVQGALGQFALALEDALPGFKMVHLLDDPERLAGFLPRLTELLEQRRVLAVADNIESLLTSGGRWRDDRWGQVITAMSDHSGLGRVVLTSRRLPAAVDSRMRVLAVDALSLDEALLLARELPHLQALISGQLADLDQTTARRLARGVLNTAQGHPKLLELADGQAATPASLAALVEAGDQAWRQAGGLPDGFFTTGESKAAGQDYLNVLAAWTTTITDSLTPGKQDLFWFLCALEEADRTRPVLEANWADLWDRLGLPGQPPDLDATLAVLAAAGLASIDPETDDEPASYGIHPGVATAGRTHADPGFQQAVDVELATYWGGAAEYGLEHEADQQTGALIVRAGLSAAPYLMRLGRWTSAAGLLERVLGRDPTPAAASAALPPLQAIAAAVADTDDEPVVTGALIRALQRIDPAAARQQLRTLLDTAVSRGDYQTASTAATYLVNQFASAGRLAEALTLAEDKARYTRQAGLGPWTQLGDQTLQLRILDAMGQAQRVVDEVNQLRTYMGTLSDDSGQSETVEPWNVREVILGVGSNAASQLGRWQDTLDLNAEITASEQARGAPAGQIARTRFNNYGALLRLGRLNDALTLLLECRQAFKDADDIDALGRTLTALADLEDGRGRGEAAVSLEQDALRYKYRSPDPGSIAISHHNLGTYLIGHTHQPQAALAHHLAAALIYILIGGQPDHSLSSAANDLRTLGSDATMPADVAGLCRQASEVPGVDLARILTALAPGPELAEQAYQQLTTRVQAAAAVPPSRHLAAWDPVIAALLAARDGDTQAAAAFDEELAQYSDSPDWAALAAALAKIRGGDTSPSLLDGLDRIDTAITSRALDALADRTTIPPALWHAIALRLFIGDVVAAAEGDSTRAANAGKILDELAKDRDYELIVAVLRRLLGGDRAPSLTAQLTEPTDEAIVATVLTHITASKSEPA